MLEKSQGGRAKPKQGFRCRARSEIGLNLGGALSNNCAKNALGIADFSAEKAKHAAHGGHILAVHIDLLQGFVQF